MKNCYDDILSLCRENGVEYSGIADLSPVRDEIIRQGGDMVRSYPIAVVFGIALQHPVVDQLPEDTLAGKITYRHHAYQVINTRLDILASEIAGKIQKYGYAALPVPASERVDNKNICSFFSHKLAARQAGLGWIGKSCMLITPDHGPRVRWGTVLTNAPFPVSSAPMEERCGICVLCVDICPVHAFTGEPFREGEPREVRYAAEKCDQYFRDMKERDEPAVCGLCLYVCPYGKRK